MKLTQKIANAFKQMPKKLMIAVLGLMVIAGAGAMVRAEFYPNRPTYDYNKACNPNDSDPYDRCGSLTGPVFNSFVNTPSYGDERAFVDARKSENTAAGSYNNVLNDVTAGSKEIVVRMYVHNNANVGTNASGLGVAKNTKVRVALPTAESQVLRARGYITADNASMVEDTVDFVGGQAFTVQYVPGSALIYNNGALNGKKISDSVVTTGAPIGFDQLNGNLPGCFEHEAVVQIRVRVMVKETPKLEFTKEVRKAGTKEWKKEVSAKPGDKIEWLLTTVAKGTGLQNNLVVRDVPAPNTQLVSGSVKWTDVNQSVTQGDKALFDGGINVGNYNAGGGFYMMYASTVKGDFEGCTVRVRNLGYVRSTQVPEIGDDADVIITKENCNPTPKNPGVSIDKKVDGVEKKTVNVNQEFNYQLVVRNTGDVNLTNVKVSDVAPANVQFISTDKGSVVGNKLTYTIPALAVGASVNINIKAKVIAEVDGDIVNTACVNAPEVNPNNPNEEDDCDDATVNVPGAVYSCDLLTSSKIGDFKFRFNTLVTARNGATFKNLTYSFGDGTAVTTADKTVEHQYAQEGTYQVRANATFTVRGKDFTVTSPACATQVTITKKPVTPVYSCDGLTSEKIGDRQYRFTVGFTARDGANLKLVKFNYGDGSEVYTTNTPVASHTFAKDGTFVTRAVLTFSVDGQDKVVDSDKCAVPVTLTSVPPTTPGTPTVLPNTGAGNMFGIFTAVTMAGAFMHRAYASRKATSL